MTAALLVWMLALGCSPSSVPQQDATTGTTVNVDEPQFLVDVSEQVGVGFIHRAGMSGELYMIELMGAGGAVLDYDNDGDLDIYLVQGHPLRPDFRPGTPPDPAESTSVPRDRFFRNDLKVNDDGSRELHFVDVTDEVGIFAPYYGMGVATGDYDRDGFIDVYVTNWGPNQLWHNNGDGTFTDVAVRAGAALEQWSTSAAFVDLDGDGWLDIYVANYLDFDYSRHHQCLNSTGVPDYCGPASLRALTDIVLINTGDGAFFERPATPEADSLDHPGLGVATGDFDSDGVIDIYVANDFAENVLWINSGEGGLVDKALMGGCAVNWMGEKESSMGVEAADLDGDGHEDIFIANMDRETNTLYLSDGRGFFTDSTRSSGLGTTSQRHTSYAGSPLDVDSDGDLDLFITNGAMQLSNDWAPQGATDPLSEPNQLYLNNGNGRFDEVQAAEEPVLRIAEISRSAVVGDLDNDGAPDLVVTNCNGPARILLNSNSSGHHWIGLRLVDAQGLSDQLGAVAKIHLAGRPAIVRRARTDGGYLSSRDPRVLIGLGQASIVERVEVHWRDGSVELFSGLEIDSYHELRHGSGSPA